MGTSSSKSSSSLNETTTTGPGGQGASKGSQALSKESPPAQQPSSSLAPMEVDASKQTSMMEAASMMQDDSNSSVEDLVRTLAKQMKDTDWLANNPPIPGAKSVFEEGWEKTMPNASQEEHEFPAAGGGDAGRWCPDGKGNGTHVPR